MPIESGDDSRFYGSAIGPALFTDSMAGHNLIIRWSGLSAAGCTERDGS